MAREVRDHLGVAERFLHGGIHARDDGGRQVLGAQQRVPIGHLEARQRLRNGGQRTGDGGAPQRWYGKGAKAPALDLRQRGGCGGEGKIDLAGDQVRHQWPAAAIGHVDGADPRLAVQQRAGQMPRAADARRTIGQHVRLGTRRRDQIRQAAPGTVRRDNEDVEDVAGHGDGREIDPRVEGEVAEKRGVDGERPDGPHQQRIAIRRGAHDEVGG